MSFGTFNTVRSGLVAAQKALDVIGRNVANANTVGYSRQEVSFTAAEPAKMIGSAGRGISDATIVRYREEFFDRQYRSHAGLLGLHDTRSQALGEVEQIFGTLTKDGLATALDQFFNSWENLSLHPSDAGSRYQVIAASDALLTSAKSTYQELADYRENLDQSIQSKMTAVNTALGEVAQLNKAIVVAEASRAEANGLYDQRDMLLDSLARLAGTVATRQSDGTMSVKLGSLLLVNGGSATTIDMTTGPEAQPPGQEITALTIGGAPAEGAFTGGDLAGLLDLRNQVVPNHMAYLDNLVRSVANQVNAVHSAGGPENIFNVGSGWMQIDINPSIKADPSKVTAAGTLPAGGGDGERARAIAALRDQQIVSGAPAGSTQVTAGDYLRSIFSGLGLEVLSTTRQAQAASYKVEQVEKQRQGVSGVSMDEEMTKMVQFQQAYNAAARMMTTIDEMLDTVVNHMGVVGR